VNVAEIMNYKVLGNDVESWLVAIFMFLATVIVLLLIKRFAIRKLSALAKHTSTQLDDFIINLIDGTKGGLLLVVALWLASGGLELPERLASALRWALTVGIFLQIGIWAHAIIFFALSRKLRGNNDLRSSTKSALGVMNFFIQVILWSVIVLLALDNLGINVTALVAGLGVGSVAIALALQNILGDIFCSISILLDKPFEVDDSITIGEFSGVVEAIGIKSTKIRSVTGEQIIISNADLLGSRIRNNRRMNERRISFNFSVIYQVDPEQLQQIPEIVKEIIEKLPSTRFDRAHLRALEPLGVAYEVVYFVLSSDYNKYMDAQQHINLELIKRFQSEQIVLVNNPWPPGVTPAIGA